MRPIKKDSTDQSVVIRIIDSTDGTPENAVEHDTGGIDIWYRREGATKTSITEAALAALDSAHSDGGIELIGDGYYRLDLPDAAVATGANGVMIGGTVTGMIVIGCYVPLVDYDPYDSVRAGLTALPNAAADGAGGLPISDAGGLDLDTKLANTNEITAARMGALTDWINGGRLDLILDIIAVDTTTDIPALIAALENLSAAEAEAACDAALATYDAPTKAEMDTAHALLATVAKQDVIDGIVDAILVDTAVIGALGAGLTAIPWNSDWDAEVQSEVQDAIEANNLDHLLKVTTGVAADGDLEVYVVAGTVMAHLMAAAADATAFKASTDSLEALSSAGSGNITQVMGTNLAESTGGNLANNLSTFLDNGDALTAKVVDDVGAPASGGGSPLVLGAGDVGDFKEDGDVHFFWNTIDRSGAAVAPSTAGTLRVYKDDGTGEVTAPTGITDTRAFDGVTGLHECKIDTSANTFYAKEKNYSVVLVGAVIDTKTVNVKIASFSIENRWANVHFHYGGK